MNLMLIIVLGIFFGTIALFLAPILATLAGFVLTVICGGFLVVAITVLEWIEDTWRKITK